MRNRSRGWNVRLLIFVLSASCLTFEIACQKIEAVPYTKFENQTEVPRITLEDAKKDFDSGSALIVDSRPEAAYDQEHIAGAINIPLGSPDEKFSGIPKGKKIIIYCS